MSALLAFDVMFSLKLCCSILCVSTIRTGNDRRSLTTSRPYHGQGDSCCDKSLSMTEAILRRVVARPFCPVTTHLPRCGKGHDLSSSLLVRYIRVIETKR